jgi:hypothetical protein
MCCSICTFAPVDPAEFCQPLDKGSKIGVVRTGIGPSHQRAEPPHAFGRLRPSRERPRRRAPEPCNEFAPSNHE